MSAIVWFESSSSSATGNVRGDRKLPSSPTAPLDRDEEAKRPVNTAHYRSRSYSTIIEVTMTRGGIADGKTSIRKAVSFEATAKSHDGLEGRSQLMDDVIKRYFVRQIQVSELDVIEMADSDADLVDTLHEDLQEMIMRVDQALDEGQTSAPVLPRGGGMCTKLSAVHVPYIKILDRVVVAAGQRLQRQKEKRASTASEVSLKDLAPATDSAVETS